MLDMLGSGNIWAAVAVIISLLLGALGVQTSRVKKNKQKADDEKKRADEAEKQKQQQQLVVKDAEEHKGEFVKQKDDVIAEIVPEIGKVKDIPAEERRELSDAVKHAAKAQAERINKRRAKK